MKITAIACLIGTVIISGCTLEPWNNPYPKDDGHKSILYRSFDERPKHLDPVRSYSANEYAIIGNIYEPPLQYHYLKRPYELIPLTATQVPVPYFVDQQGQRLPSDAKADAVAFSIYEIEIQPGIRYQPHPALAKKGERYRYHDLTRQDLESQTTLADFQYHGTRELLAEDYVYQIKRLAHPDLHSPIFGVMAQYIDGLSDYANTLKQAHAQLADDAKSAWLDLRHYDLPAVQVIDRYRYRIRIKGKYPQFQYWLAMPFFAPMPWEADRFHSQEGMVDKNLTLHWYPIGTGPYMLAENNPNLRMVLIRNPNFHGERYPIEGEASDRVAGLLADAGKPLPMIDQVVSSLEKESIPRWNKFLQGYYDVSGISSDAFNQAITVSDGGQLGLSDKMDALGMRLTSSVATSTYYFGFNMLDPIVGHPAGIAGQSLRQAIAMAVDYEEYISIFLNGRGMVAQSPLPPGIYGHIAGQNGLNTVTHRWQNGKPVRRSIEQAKQLLSQAGYPKGRDPRTGQSLKLYYDTVARGPDSKAQLNWWRKQFAKLGIELVIRSTDYNRFQDKMQKGNAQMFSWGWNADYPDPENFLFLLYGNNGKVQHHGENAANYANERFDRLFEQMKNMENNPQRLAIIQEMTAIIRQDAPWIWGIHPQSYVLYHQWYHNVKPNLMANNTLKYKRIDSSQRRQMIKQWNPPIIWPIGVLLVLFMLIILPAVYAYRKRQQAKPQIRHQAQ